MRVCAIEREMGKKARTIIVGGSIAGLSSAHALIEAGCEVLVLEKASSRPSRSATGAGLGLDSQSCRCLSHWLGDAHLLANSTLPLQIEQNQATDSQRKVTVPLSRDEDYGFRAAHWNDLHGLLYTELPSGVVLWGHQFLNFQIHDKSTVKVQAKVLESGNIVEIVGDLLVAADGCLSEIRRHFLPSFGLRYSGYSAWRGVLDFSQDEHSQTMIDIHDAYPELGNCLYFDLSEDTHCVLYELQNKRLNWLWYVNQPEPEVKGNSVTMSVSGQSVENMHAEAEKVWLPALAKAMKETMDPFVNAIYDSDPLEKLHWDNVVLVGDAAHPTTPHGLRSTNMSIVDAVTLGQCIGKHGMSNLSVALKEYENFRLPVVSQQVLHSRKLGRWKQGLHHRDLGHGIQWKDEIRENCVTLLQRNNRLLMFKGRHLLENGTHKMMWFWQESLVG